MLNGQEETELAKLRALIKEEQLARPPPPDAEVEALIKAVFADHLLGEPHTLTWHIHVHVQRVGGIAIPRPSPGSPNRCWQPPASCNVSSTLRDCYPTHVPCPLHLSLAPAAANPDFEKYFLAYKQQPASDPNAAPPPRPHRGLLTFNAVHPEPSPPPDLATSPQTNKLTSASPTTTTTNSSWRSRYLSSPTRAHVYSLLSYPDYSPAAFVVGMLLLCVVVLNTATTIVESVPAYENTPLYDRLV